MFLENIKNNGCIEVICGSMFSGKTEELIRRIRRAKFANLKIEIFKPSIDTRYAVDDVVSHDFHKIPCHAVRDPREMLDIADDVQVVGIDEAQFYDLSLVEVAQTPFGPMPYLMAVAEEVRKVHAICVRCGNLANHSHRLSDSEELVVLGEKDAYEPLCRECYNKAIAAEKAKA